MKIKVRKCYACPYCGEEYPYTAKGKRKAKACRDLGKPQVHFALGDQYVLTMDTTQVYEVTKVKIYRVRRGPDKTPRHEVQITIKDPKGKLVRTSQAKLRSQFEQHIYHFLV